MLVQHEIPVEDEIAQFDPRPGPNPLVIVVPGAMRGKGRPRFARMGKGVRAFTDAATANAETWVKACAIEQVGQPMLATALAMNVSVIVPIPRSWPKKRQEQARRGELLPTGKPDLDNIVKLIADALNGIVWHDDAQVCALSTTKAYGDEPQTTIRVSEA